MISISVVILTYQEAMALGDCLKSLTSFDDIHVLDSGSQDATCRIAREHKCHVETHAFHSFGEQRNWALKHLALKYDWVLFLDADERSTPEFEQEIVDAVTNASTDIAGYYCCWKLMLNRRWLKHSDFFPRWQFRLMHRDRACFVDFGHGQKEKILSGHVEYIRKPYLHEAFLKGWEDWEQKHRRYSKQEAKERMQYRFHFSELTSPHASVRNKAIKSLVISFPFWPLFRFVYPWLMRGGFLEGKEGRLYCWKISRFEKWVVQESRRLNSTLR